MKHLAKLLKRHISRIVLMACVLTFALPTLADDLPDYQIEGAGTGSQGTYLVRVSVLSKKSKVSDDEIGRCAIHGVLFRGFASKENRQQQKPLAGSPMVEMQQKAFFDDFFKSAYQNYYQMVSGSRQVVKAGKQYKVTSVVTVSKDQLRKDLVAADVIKGLNTGF
ncbi:MAG: hypothetical protein IJ064_06325 [Bacteroidaceae bacterium]|nr:hypothetical protein [Bacteroidaceae bacterium]